jgi:hypothetical protein
MCNDTNLFFGEKHVYKYIFDLSMNLEKVCRILDNTIIDCIGHGMEQMALVCCINITLFVVLILPCL